MPSSSGTGSRLGMAALGLYLGVSFLAYVSLLFWSWEVAARAVVARASASASLLDWHITVTPDLGLLCVVLSSSMLGSTVHALMSFSTYVGNRSFRSSWIAWYVFRAPLGASLALVLYFVSQSGLLAANGSPGAGSVLGAAAIGGMAGLFAKQASDKLEEVFDTVFRTGPGYGDGVRSDGSTAKS